MYIGNFKMLLRRDVTDDLHIFHPEIPLIMTQAFNKYFLNFDEIRFGTR